MRSELEIFGLISIAELPAAERAKLDDSDFFGFEADIESLKQDARTAVKSIIDREWPDIEWDGVASLRMAAVTRFREICQRNRGLAIMDLRERKLEAARKVLANHKANGGLSKAVVEDAESIVSEVGSCELDAVVSV